MSLLSLGGFNLLCFWASTGANLWARIHERIDFVHEIAHEWLQQQPSENEKILKIMNNVQKLQASTPTIISEITKPDLLEIIDSCYPVCVTLHELSEVENLASNGQKFVNESLTIIEEVLTLAEQILMRLPGENQQSAMEYTKRVDDCLLNIIPF